jgi:hypothetical protein
MAELKPLEPIRPVTQPVPGPAPEKVEQAPEKVEGSTDLLKMVNGELCYTIPFKNGDMIVTLSKCERLIPAFATMKMEQKETFLMQAAIFGANPFGTPPEIYPVPFKNKDGSTTFAPVISYKKFIDYGASNPNFDGFKSGVVVETPKGEIINRLGQVYGSKDTLIG